MTTDVQPGALVRVRGERWRLARIDSFDRCAVLTLEGRDAGNRGRRLRLLSPFDRATPIRVGKWRRRPRRAVIASALAAVAAARPASGLWTAARAAIDVREYQLEPAMAVIGGATRVLLADEVGLGKTIQAGLILAELHERGWVERALVVCPAGLRAAWIEELAARFGIAASPFDQDGVAEAASSLPPGVNPWATAGVAVASLDYLKRADVLAAAAAVPFDLLIVDEAHHLAPGTDRGRAMERLARQAPWCVLASATPHSGDQAAYDYLCSLGSHGDGITVFRRNRADAGIARSRRTRVLAVRPAAAEAALLSAVDRYADAIWKACGRTTRAAQLLAILLARRAASSALAIERTLTRRLSILDGRAVAVQPRLPWEDEEDDDREDDAVLGAAGLEDAAQERRIVAGLIARAQRCGAGSKIRRALRLAARTREPVILFTEFRDTVDAVVAAVPPEMRAACLHGGMPAAERRQVIAAFNSGAADLLVATDAAGEGLNLQHRCRLVVNLELPWNPLRLEQRAGRVDRLGQRRRVHVIHLFHPGGIEDRVRHHLQLRQQRADLDVMNTPLAEMDVARAIFDGVWTAPAAAPITSTRIAGARDEADRIHRARAAGHCRLLEDAAWTRSRTRRTCLAALCRVTSMNPHGSIVEERIDAWRLDLSPAPARREWPAVIAQIAGRLPPPEAPEHRPRAEAAARIAAIREQLARRRPAEVQPSLFDRREEDRAREEAQHLRQADAALQRCLAAIAPADARAVSRAALIAAWPLGRP